MMQYPTAKIADFCRTGSGGTPSRSNMQRYYGGGNIPWVKSGELRESLIVKTEEHVTESALKETSIKLVPPGAILLAMYGATVGRLAILGVEATTNQAVCHIIPDPNVADTRYLYYALASQVPAIVAMGVGGAQPNISQGLIKELKVPLPPLNKQRRIAAILDQADALRAKRREALAQLDSLTQSIFMEMFGDPVTTTKDWPVVHLSDVTEMITGYAFRSEEYVASSNDSIKLCRGANVMPGRLDWDDLACWPVSNADDLSAFQLEESDVVIAMDRPWISEGFKIAQVQQSDCPSLLVQRVARIRGRQGISNDYVYHLLNQPAFTRHCRPTETTVPHISPRDIRSFKFHLPPESLRQTFVERITVLRKQASIQVESLAELDSLFASLQHRAFRGEL